MADSSKKTSELAVAANVAATDRILILRDPSGTPSTRTITLSNFCANIVLSNSAPANSSANGIKGEIKYDSDYLYICTANNTWTRVAISSW